MALTFGTLLSSQGTNAHHTRPTSRTRGNSPTLCSADHDRQTAAVGPPTRTTPRGRRCCRHLRPARQLTGVRGPGAKMNTTTESARRQLLRGLECCAPGPWSGRPRHSATSAARGLTLAGVPPGSGNVRPTLSRSAAPRPLHHVSPTRVARAQMLAPLLRLPRSRAARGRDRTPGAAHSAPGASDSGRGA